MSASISPSSLFGSWFAGQQPALPLTRSLRQQPTHQAPKAIFLMLGLFGLGQVATGQHLTQVIPCTSTFLRTDPSDTPAFPIAINLTAQGISGGSYLRLRTVGNFLWSPGQALFGTAANAMFSSSPTVLSQSTLARVPGAVQIAAPRHTTAPTFLTGLPTDVPEDFLVDVSDVFVQVPNVTSGGSCYLLVGASDVYWGDNMDPEADFAIDCQVVPDPMTPCAVRYTMNGTFLDISGNGRHATAVGSPLFEQIACGEGARFDNPAGSGSATQFLSIPDLDPIGAGSFSIAMRLKTTDATQANGRLFGGSVGSDGVFFNYNRGASENASMFVNYFGTGGFQLFDGAAGQGALISDGSCHWMVLVIDRATQTATGYIDGLLQQVSIVGMGPVPMSNLRIGGSYVWGVSTATSYASRETTVEEFMLWGRALGSTEVQGILGSSSATNISYGNGCGGLALTVTQLPILGQTLLYTTSNIPSSATLSIQVISFVQINPGVPLASLGAPGCEQLVDLNYSASVYLPGNPTAQYSIAIPAAPAMVGLPLNCQSAAIDLNFNALGIMFSNGVRSVVSWY